MQAPHRLKSLLHSQSRLPLKAPTLPYKGVLIR
nr:MAG TPA: hypothetical protein [Caudoviricetes sp.]